MYLDGLNDLRETLNHYKIEQDDSWFNLQNTVWLRATIPVHVALTCIRSVAVQSIRGAGNLLGGIILFDGKRILMGLNDYLSLLVQAVVLPVLGFIVFLAPKAGYHILVAFKKIETDRKGASPTNIHFQCRGRPDFIKINKESKDSQIGSKFLNGLNTVFYAGYGARERVTDVMMGFLGSLSAVVQTVTLTVERVADLHFIGNDSVWKNLVYDVGPLIPYSIAAPFTADTDNAYLAHRMYKDS